jgi:hypothetical protein
MTQAAKDAMDGDRGDARAQPSGPKGDNPATAGSGETRVKSETAKGGSSGPAEQAEGQLNPSSPGDTGTTPGSNAKVG